MTELIRAVDSKPLARVESSLLRVRWVLWVLVLPIAWLENGGAPFPLTLWAWLASVAIINLVIFAFIRLAQPLNRRFGAVTLILDTLLFGSLSFLSGTGLGLLAFFTVFPALVGALRFGPQVGLLIAGLITLAFETVVALAVMGGEASIALFATTLPIVVLLFVTAILVGYLSERERDAAVKQAAAELDDLRGAMAGAQLLYKTTDRLSSSTSYGPVLDAMLEAGVKGIPQGRREDGMAVGVALLFEDRDQCLHVASARHLERRDLEQYIPAREGIVFETLSRGEPVVSDNIGGDPELGVFNSLRRCRGGACFPLQAGLEQYGVVVLASPAPRRLSAQHLELMRAFTNQAAIAFQNAKLYQNLRAEHDEIIQNENEMRQKLARDLHDGPTQKVAALVMQLDYITRLLDRNPEEAKTELFKAREIAQQTVKEIRTSLFALRPLTLETKGLSAALEQYCERLREAEHVPIEIEPGKIGTEIDPNLAATIFAIIEEAVNNARKHAGGATISVSISRQNNTLIALIQDQGPGFDLDKVMSSYEDRASLGLQNMRDRAKLIDGDLRIDSQPGHGTRITLVVPLPATEPTGKQL